MALLRRLGRLAEALAHDRVRLERHLDADTKVVIAHSLGTVIAYQVLCARPDLNVDLITLGSPLGDANMVFDLLQPPPVDGRGVWPVAVRRWTNVAAEGDLATAGCPQLAERFGVTLVGFLRGDRFNVYAGAERLGLKAGRAARLPIVAEG